MNKGINKKNIDKLIEYLKKNNINYNDGRINLSISSSDKDLATLQAEHNKNNLK